MNDYKIEVIDGWQKIENGKITKIPDKPTNFDIAYGVAVTPDFYCKIDYGNEWIEISRNVHYQSGKA